MAASIYRSGSSPTRFQQFAAGPTHYTTSVDPMHHLRYNSFAIDGHQVPLPSTPPTRGSLGGSLMAPPPSTGNNNNNNSSMSLSMPPPGATLGLLNGSNNSSSNASMGKSLYMHQQQQQYQQQHMSSGAPTQPQRHSSPIYSSAPSPLFINPMLAKSYQQHMERQMSMMQQHSNEPLLLVSPGMPTPLELSIYEVKQPTGFLHVTIGNQTVEFLDGVANMPRKR